MKAFSPIQLGSLTLPSNIVQGPLAGYSCAPFRSLIARFKYAGFCTTEMISAHDLVYRDSKPKRYLHRNPNEALLCFQLAAKAPDVLARAIDIVEKAGADLIDLNCGCPVQKIRKKQMGSKLLENPEHLFSLVKAMRDQTDAAISVKIRISDDQCEKDKAVIDAVQSAGIDYIVVHGRTWRERYDVNCQLDRIKALVDYATVPVFANGDVEDYPSLENIIKHTQCSGVMISRGSVGQPWLFAKLEAAAKNKPFSRPRQVEIGNMLLEHVRELIGLHNEVVAVLQSRKLAKYYARTLSDKKDFILQAQQVITFEELRDLVFNAFK